MPLKFAFGVYVTAPVVGFTVTVPFVGFEVIVTEVRFKPPASVSFAGTAITTDASSFVEVTSAVAFGGKLQFSVKNTSVAVAELGHPGVGTVYKRFTVVFPAPVNVNSAPDKVAGPVTLKVPPGGSAVTSMVE